MSLITRTRPAPPEPIPVIVHHAPIWTATRLTGRGLFWLAAVGFKLLFQSGALSLACLYWLANQTIRGRFRHHLRPAWVACLAWYPAWWTPLAWLGLAVALYLFPTALYLFPMGDRISPREQASLADAACLLAAWQVIAPIVDWPVQVALFLEFTAAGLFPWWASRAWKAEIPALPDEWEERWEIEVAASPKAGPLAGTVLTLDPTGDRYRLTAPRGSDAAAIAKADPLACSLLARAPGTVTISLDPDATINDFLVAFTDREDGTVARYWDGITRRTTENGLTEITVADAIDSRPMDIPLTQPGGVSHGVVLAGSGHGKGILMRIICLEMCLWDKAWLAVADCKGEDQGGAGLPEFRDWADVYGWSRDQWKASVLMFHELYSARAGRYGAAQRPFWHPDATVDGYLDPAAYLVIDELGKMMRAHGSKDFVSKLEDLAAAGRSFGCGVWVDNQRGGRNDIVTPGFRNNIRKNGTALIGQFGDRNSGSVAVQDLKVDLTKLPTAPGWWYIKGGITDVPAVKARSRLLASVDEVEFLGLQAPHGTVEEWLARTVSAKLHPADQEIVDKWRPEFVDTAAAVPEPIPEPVVTSEEPAPGVHVEAAPRILHAVPTQPLPDTKAAIDVIVEVLRQSGPMTRGEVAKAVRIADTYASERLKTLERLGKVTRTATLDGRAGWKATA
jgi:hypothetical protein